MALVRGRNGRICTLRAAEPPSRGFIAGTLEIREPLLVYGSVSGRPRQQEDAGSGRGPWSGAQFGWKGLLTQPATMARRLGRWTARKPKGRSKSTLA